MGLGYAARRLRISGLGTVVRLYSLHHCSTSPRDGVKRDRYKHMKRLSVVPEPMVRHLMPLGNKRALDTA